MNSRVRPIRLSSRAQGLDFSRGVRYTGTRREFLGRVLLGPVRVYPGIIPQNSYNGFQVGLRAEGSVCHCN